jgi:class 3 adenylate cyclase/tetratricopeptide (TPR) repeat protein
MRASESGEYRRYAILLFADLCAFTSLNEAVDPEDVAQILHAIRNEVDVLVREHGGSVNEWRGDGVLCTFGLPRSSELDAQRAVEAALAMHAAVAKIGLGLPIPKGFQLQLHSGLHGGLVFATEREDAQGYDLVGDAVNTAARLCEAADSGEILASSEMIEGVKELFETAPIEHLLLKGKKSPVPVYRVIRRSDVATRFAASQRRGLTPLVAREDALARLHVALASALAGKVTVLSVIGNPGAGKTRILEEFRVRALASACVVSGRCGQTPNAKPLEPFIEILLIALGVRARATRDEVVEALAALIARLDPGLHQHETAFLHLLGLEPHSMVSPNPELVRKFLIDALSDLFAALCRIQPLVITLDDWQWADDASRQVLNLLIRRLEHSTTLLLVAARDSRDPVLAEWSALELRPFTSDESAQVIAALLPAALDLGFKRAIHERSGGNPLFLEELCRALPSAAPAGMEDLAIGKVPTSLRGIIQGRVERLRRGPLEVLSAAAVIGPQIPLWLLLQVSGVSDVRAELADLVREDLLFEVELENCVRFKHATTKDVVYESIRLPQRRRLHRATAEALRKHTLETKLPEPYEELAYHCAGAGEHEQAAHFAELAGDKATAASSLDRARQQYRVALDALEKLGLEGEIEQRWFALVSKWATASLYSPAPEHLELLERFLTQAQRSKDALAASRAQYWLGWFHYALGNQTTAIAHCRSALQTANESKDERMVGQLHLNLAQSLTAAGKYAEALAYFRVGLEAKRHTSRNRHMKPIGQRRAPLGFAYALACRGLLHGDQGHFPEAYRCFEDALEALGATGHAVEGSCLGLLAMVQLFQGRWQQALDSALKTQQTAERVNGPYVFATSETVSGYARWMLERSGRALAELEHAVRWIEGRGVLLCISFNYGYLAEALFDAGMLDQASEFARRAVARAPADPLGEASGYRTLARLAGRTPGADVRALLTKAMTASVSRHSAREIALTDLASVQLLGPHASLSDDPRAAFRAMNMDHYEREAERLLG